MQCFICFKPSLALNIQGPICFKPSTTGLAQKIQGLVDDAVAKGAKVLAGGKLPQHLPGQFYPPTVITNVNKNMEIWSEEVFGPVGVSRKYRLGQGRMAALLAGLLDCIGSCKGRWERESIVSSGLNAPYASCWAVA
eukprot:742869-Pelagomonas_calceolata.AAC.3